MKKSLKSGIPRAQLANSITYVFTSMSIRRCRQRSACQGPTRGEYVKVYRLLVDGGIRWNSTEAMISRGMSLPRYLYHIVLAVMLTNISDQTPRRISLYQE